jgi:acetyl esterase
MAQDLSASNAAPTDRKRRRLIVGATALVAVIIVGFVSFTYLKGRLLGNEPARWPSTNVGATEVVEYKQTAKRPLHLHLFKPTSEPTSAIVFFHGGGLDRTPIDQFARQSKHLAQEGVLAVIAEYRVKWDDAGFGEASADAGDAVAWIRTHAAELGVPPDKIAASGASAGGMLAAATELFPDDRHPDILVLFNPAVNSGSANDSGGVPTLVMHGDSDHQVALSSAQGFCDALKTCEIMIWPGGDHGFFNDDPAYTATLKRVDEFLSALGYLQT